MHLLVFSLLLAAAARSVVSQNIPEQWDMPDDAALDEYFDDLREDQAWPMGPEEYVGLVLQDRNMLTTPEPNAVEEDPDRKEPSTWKMALVGATLLVCLLGSLSLAYYMCIWRGGRIHYDLQKDVSI